MRQHTQDCHNSVAPVDLFLLRNKKAFDLDEIVDDHRYTKERKNLNKGLEPDLIIPVIVYVSLSEIHDLKSAPEHYKNYDIVEIIAGLGLLPFFHFFF